MKYKNKLLIVSFLFVLLFNYYYFPNPSQNYNSYFNPYYQGSIYNIPANSYYYIAGYDTINTGLIKKYGEPDFTEISGECYGWSVGKGFFNKIHSVQVNHTEETAFGNSVYSDAEYSQWLIMQSDGSSILISHYKFVMNNAKRNIINREEHYVIYELLDAEKTETILNEIQQKSSDL